MPSKPLEQRRRAVPSKVWSKYLDTLKGDEVAFLRELRDVVRASGASYISITETAGVYETCLTNWFRGKAQPTPRTLCPVLRALGYRLAIVPLEAPDASS